MLAEARLRHRGGCGWHSTYFELATDTYTYAYAGDGLRRHKTAPDGTVTEFTWDRSGALPLLLAEATRPPGAAAPSKIVRYVYSPDGTVLAQITEQGGTQTIRWYHHDQIGSTRALTDNTGTVTTRYSYTPFGEPQAQDGDDLITMGWAGEYQDPETGLVYLRARYYDPKTAQFLTRDPIEHTTFDPYGYAANNPVNYTDPAGLKPSCPPGHVDVAAGPRMDCQMLGDRTPMRLTGPGSGRDVAEDGCDDPTHTHADDVNPADPSTYNPSLQVMDPYGPFVGAFEVFVGLVGVIDSVAACVGGAVQGAIWGSAISPSVGALAPAAPIAGGIVGCGLGYSASNFGSQPIP